MASIQVAPENQNYMDVDGILFSKEQEVLVAYPVAKTEQSYSIPEGVKSIAKAAFGFSALTSVTIPDSVTNIGSGAFESCRSLESIKILNPNCEIDDSSRAISDTAVIYGYLDSTAHAYAEKYDLEFVALDEKPGTTEPVTEPETDPTTEPETVWGDISGDGVTDITDVVFMNRVYVGVDKLPDGGLSNADTDQDGKITLSDSMNVLRLLVHLLTPEDFPIQAE